MRDQVRVTGIVLSVMPVGENDRRVTILTKERGKLQAFARGARKPNHQLFGVTQPLVYGEFMVSDGRTASYMNSGVGKDYFPALRSDLACIYYGTYFAELAEYFTVEGMDERDTLNLLFVTLKTMEKQQIPLELIRRIYEFRILHHYGIGLSVFACMSCGKEEAFQNLFIDQGGVLCEECRQKKLEDKKEQYRYRHPVKLTPALLYALQFVSAAPLGRLYSFRLSDDIFTEYAFIVKHFMRLHVDHRFRSEQMLEMI